MTLEHRPANLEEHSEMVELEVGSEQELWARQDPALALVRETPIEFFGQFGEVLFRPRAEYEITCMDERVSVSVEGRGRIAIAGSGVLQSPDQMDEVIAKIRKAGINVVGVRRHNGCGAEGIAKKNGLDDQMVAAKAPQLADLLGSAFGGFSPMFAVENHVARGMILVGARHFHDDLFRGDYTPLIISERFTPMALVEAVTGVTIAFGPHNHRNDFTPESPFVLTVVGDPTSKWHRTDQVTAAVRSALLGDPRTAPLKRSGKIRINGFDALTT